MKKTLFSIGASVLLLTGCANNLNLGLGNKINKNESVRELIANNQNHHILADSNKKVLFTSYAFGSIGNSSSTGLVVDDILNTRNDLKKLCEAKGGKWDNGLRYNIIVKEDPLNFKIFTLNENPDNNYLGVCKLPNGNGFKVKELGIFDYEVLGNIPEGFGGGENIGWYNFYEIDYNKPVSETKDYLNWSIKKVSKYEKKDYLNFNDVINIYNQMALNGDIDNLHLALVNNICHNLGGTAYIKSTDTNMKTMTLNDYLFMSFDKLFDKYYNEPETLNKEYHLFPLNAGKKAYIWCQNNTNPNNQFMLIWQPDNETFKVIKGYKPSLIPQSNIQNNNQTNVNNSINNAVRNSIANAVSKITYHPHIDDKNAYNLAKGMFEIRADIKVANNPYVKYYGRYIGKIGSCEYASVEKKAAGVDEIYNFKQCNGNMEYTGQTLKGLTQAEYNRFKPYLNGLKQSCETDGRALVQVNGLNLYCRSNRNGGYKIFILNDKFQFLDELR